ncbi:MAG: shikimate dehydrogenase [Bacteroidales bacterium]|jgi:shikimate dehydrogenase|nr:shikimate dehydrogenase [Bacteroidales bacterium]
MRLFGIIGNPLGHSFSQHYFTAKFIRENLKEHSYRKFELTSIDQLPELLERESDLCGFNVTIPYKVQIFRYLDNIDPVAEAIGAVNTVRIIREKGSIVLSGFNTDAPAFRKSLLLNLDKTPEYGLVLGTGGASKSVTYILRELGIKPVPVSRNHVDGGYPYDDLPGDVVSGAGLVINTTPVGMSPHIDNSPAIDYSLLHEGQLLFDLIYNPPVTQFLARGSERGCHILNGEEMFQFQAEMAWGIWNSEVR